ncbi:MAG: hypothetical protein AAF620_13660 [Bacteroidota bacterium]
MNTQKTLFTLAKVIPVALMIVFGFNKFLGFIRLEPFADEIVQTSLGIMFTKISRTY